jgi:hypothetical protein
VTDAEHRAERDRLLKTIGDRCNEVAALKARLDDAETVNAGLKARMRDALDDASALRRALSKAHPEAQSCSICRGYHGKKVQHACE